MFPFDFKHMKREGQIDPTEELSAGLIKKRAVERLLRLLLPGAGTRWGPPSLPADRSRIGAESELVVRYWATLEVQGQPTKTLKAGDVFSIPPETIHEGTNNGTVTDTGVTDVMG